MLASFTIAPSVLKFGPLVFTSAQVQGMFAAPLTLIPAQGAGSLILNVDIILENNASGVAYAGGGAIILKLGTITLVGSTSVTFLTTPTTPVISDVKGQSVISPSGLVTPASVLNQPLTLSNLTAPFTGGSGNLVVSGLYSVVRGL